MKNQRRTKQELEYQVLKILQALAMVHELEHRLLNPHGLKRPQACKQAIERIGLNKDEEGVLLRAVHVSPSEL